VGIGKGELGTGPSARRKNFVLMWIPERLSLLTGGMTQYAFAWFLALGDHSALNVSIAMAIIQLPKAR
jgi:hypothetical protein